MPELHFTTVAKVGAIPVGKGVPFLVGDKLIAVFRTGEAEYHAINDCCPHMGAALSDGEMHGDTVLCPWHAWRFRVTDGTWCDNPKIKTDVYAVRVMGEEIQVGVTNAAGK